MENIRILTEQDAAAFSKPCTDVEFYEFGSRMFAYNRDRAMVYHCYETPGEEIAEMSEDERAELLNGVYWAAEGVGLSREHWDDLEARTEYLEEYCAELDEDLEYMMDDFIRYELPGLQKEMEQMEQEEQK